MPWPIDDIRAALILAAAQSYEPTPLMVMHPRDRERVEAERRPGESDPELIARIIREGK